MSIPIHVYTKSQMKDLIGAKTLWSRRCLSAPRTSGLRAFAATAAPSKNVVGVGVAEKLTEGRPTGVLGVKFFVIRKFAESELARSELLPKLIDGLPVDVEETGLFCAFVAPSPMPNPKSRYRPAQPGSSIGFQFPPPNPQGVVMAGTFGALVRDAVRSYILSNNHVLADENRLVAGAPIFQPGLLDGGRPTVDQVAKLTRFVKLQPSVPNHVDCAIAAGLRANLLSRDILHIGPPAGVVPAVIDQRVHKFGRTTSYTVGHVTSITTDVTVQYETGPYTFADQIIVVGDGHPFSAAGDSGSLILERQTNRAIGLLFAGSASHTIANHLPAVLSALRVTLA